MWQYLYDSFLGVGFAVQRWPVLWLKTHPCQNMAGNYNFTKNYEIAIIARKKGGTLITPQSTSYWQGSGLSDKDQFGHPFAKPVKLWQWLYSAVAIKGQRVLDPFAGSGSSTVAAIGSGLAPTAVEINESHYNRLVVNVSNAYRALHPNVKFT
jgi:DNA modification methylase